MPEQAALSLEAPVAPPPAPKAPAAPRRYELPAEPEPVAKAPPKVAETPPPAQKAEPEAAPETEETPTEEKKDLTPEEVEKRRESRRFERRIDKLTRRAAEAQARAELAEKTLAERSQTKAPVDDAAPTLEKFDYDPEKYAAAKAEYAKKAAEKEFTEKQKTEGVKKQREALISSWEEKAEKASDKYEDFETVVGKMSPTDPLTQSIMEADADVAYFLGKHPKELAKITELPTVTARILALGRLEAKLAATPEKPKAPSKAPEPIKPLSGAGSQASDVPSEQDDMKTWMAKRNKQVHGKQRR